MIALPFLILAERLAAGWLTGIAAAMLSPQPGFALLAVAAYVGLRLTVIGAVPVFLAVRCVSAFPLRR